MIRLPAIISILLICIVTLNLWFISKEDINSIMNDPLLSLSQLLSLLAITLMSVSMILTTRVRFLENVFGGLDKLYQIHRIIGGVAFVFVLNHPLLLAAKTATTPSVSLMYLIPGSNLAYNLGIFALYLFILAFVFIVFIRLPYHLWKRTHYMLGGGFLLSSLHIFTIGSDIGRSVALRGWIFFLIAVGVMSIIYAIFLYKRIGPKYVYAVDRIQRSLDIIHIWLSPVSKKLFFNAGQFVFIRFKNKEIGEEIHPFSLSSAGFEENIRLSIKILGDYTLKLPNLKQGDRAEIFGPYGSFGKSCKSKDQCWVAGGVGITPFLSMLRDGLRQKKDRNITLFYCYKNSEEGIFCDEIWYLVKELGNVKFINWCSKEKGRLDAKKIAEEVSNIQDTEIMLCGPTGMMEQLKKKFLKLNVPEGNIIYEKFQMV